MYQASEKAIFQKTGAMYTAFPALCTPKTGAMYTTLT
jgi:hypothetical protein